MRTRTAGALALAIAAAGCGGAGSPAAPERETAPEPPLTSTERQAVRKLEARLQRHCIQVAQSLVDPGAAPRPAQERRAFAAADRLVGLAARRPRAPLGAGQDLRLFLSDTIENLEGSNCDPRLISHLERGLGRIPVDEEG